MPNALTVFTHFAKLSIDRSVELTADVHFLVFTRHSKPNRNKRHESQKPEEEKARGQMILLDAISANNPQASHSAEGSRL